MISKQLQIKPCVNPGSCSREFTPCLQLFIQIPTDELLDPLINSEIALIIPDNPLYLAERESQFRGVFPNFSLSPTSSLFEDHSLFDENYPKMMIFNSDNTLFTRIFGVLVINKQSENDHCKGFMCDIGGNDW